MAKFREPAATVNGSIVVGAGEYRPCYVTGRRALFHRWADTRRPVTPRGMDETETDRRYQVWHVHAIVEFEDGTLARVWPSEVQFANDGTFDAAWGGVYDGWQDDDAPGTEI